MSNVTLPAPENVGPMSLGTRLVVAAVVLGALFGAPAAWCQQPAYQVVVNSANPVSSLLAEELSDLLLKKKTIWADGTTVEPVDLSPSSPVREAFSNEVLGRPVAAVKSYWQTQVFSGSLVPPAELDSEAQVLAFVRDHRGGVGYVAGGTPLAGVKAVSLLVPPQRVRFVEPRYPPGAAAARAEGNVLLRLTIGPTGEVTHVEVLQGQPMGMTEEAVRAARLWKYRPANRNGQPVEAPVEVTVHFGH